MSFYFHSHPLTYGQLFPNWRGTFDGSRPSLAGLDGDHVIDALEGGLMTENELKGLLYLIREPDVRTLTSFKGLY